MSRIRVNQLGFIFVLLCVVGCRRETAPVENVVPVSGSVFYDGKPAEGASLSFIPTGTNVSAHTGSGVADADGQFEMLNYQRKNGLPPGTYIVIVSMWRMPDGTIPVSEKPVLSGAKEVIPLEWNRIANAGAHNTVTVPEDGKTDFEFKLPK